MRHLRRIPKIDSEAWFKPKKESFCFKYSQLISGSILESFLSSEYIRQLSGHLCRKKITQNQQKKNQRKITFHTSRELCANWTFLWLARRGSWEKCLLGGGLPQRRKSASTLHKNSASQKWTDTFITSLLALRVLTDFLKVLLGPRLASFLYVSWQVGFEMVPLPTHKNVSCAGARNFWGLDFSTAL